MERNERMKVWLPLMVMKLKGSADMQGGKGEEKRRVARWSGTGAAVPEVVAGRRGDGKARPPWKPVGHEGSVRKIKQQRRETLGRR